MKHFFIICFLLLPLLAFGKVEKITKTERVVVPSNQSVEQVLKYTSEKLARMAAEEAGVAISANTTLVDGKISKDEVKMQTSAIAQKETKLLKQETVDGITYITVAVTATVDSDELDAFLRQLMQNEALKKELEQERIAKLELEKKLQKATKEEYNSTLSKEAENIAQVQKARQKQLEKEMANAKQQFMEAERKQKAEELSAMQELERIEREYKAQDAALQKKIAEEKNAEVKAEMEHQALLAELAKNALVNDKKLDTAGSDTIEIIVLDAASVRVNFSALIKEYKVAMEANEKKMNALHSSQIETLKKQTYNEKKPVKGEWESTKDYNARLIKYNDSKKAYEENKKQKIKNLENTHQAKLENSKKETTQSMVKALSPLYDRLVKYSNGKYNSSNTAKAVISFGERDVDNMRLPIEIKYKNAKYSFTYQFDNIQEFRAMYDTKASFKAIPLFAAEAKGLNQAQPYLRGFNVVHLGNNKKKFFQVTEKHDAFPEVLEYEKMKEELSNKKKETTNKVEENTNKNQNNNKIKQNTSDTYVNTPSYKQSYWLYGINLGGSFDLDMMNMELAAQSHWRFNRWFGIYINASVIVGFNGLSSSSSSYDDDYDDYYEDYYNSYYKQDTFTIDTGLVLGLGADIYLSNSFLLFTDVNAAYFIEDNGKNSIAGVFRGGLALQSANMGRTGMRFNIFVESIISDTISGKTPFFGAGIYF